MRILFILFSLFVGVCNAQVNQENNRLLKLQDSLLTKYNLILHGMRFYHKSDSSNRSIKLELPQEIKQKYEGIGDFLLFLDEKGNIEKAKLVNIEITNSVTNRFVDWKIFLESGRNDYDIENDVGIDLESLSSIHSNTVTKKIAAAMLIYLKNQISFGRPNSKIVYYSFSF